MGPSPPAPQYTRKSPRPISREQNRVERLLGSQLLPVGPGERLTSLDAGEVLDRHLDHVAETAEGVLEGVEEVPGYEIVDEPPVPELRHFSAELRPVG